MDIFLQACRIVSAIVFVGYGGLCLHRTAMVSEFERFGAARFRVLTGWLEILGGLGLVVSFWLPALLPFAAGGLGLLMFFAVLARARVRDSLLKSSPALVLMVGNGLLAFRAAGGHFPS
ncbi:MAG: DoxX family protein [Planctomycetota bacterium]|nr:DoxX family protein [Planctomycetota bacterium]